MRVALVHATSCDAHKLGLVERLDILGATISHAGAYAAKELIDDLVERTLLWDSRRDALGNEFLHVALGILEVAIL